MAKSGMVVAREACVVVVGAVPPTYETFTAIHNRTGQPVVMNKDQPSDPGSEGIPYTFRPYQKVPRNHAAVKASPSSFAEIEDLSPGEQELAAQ